MFQLNMYKVNYTHSFLKGTALNYFEPCTATPFGPMTMLKLSPNSGPTSACSTLKLMQKMSLNGSKGMITRNMLNTLSAFKSSPPKSIGVMLPHKQFYNGHPSHIKDKITRVGKPDNLNLLHTFVQSINAHYWECHSEISCEDATVPAKLTNLKNP